MEKRRFFDEPSSEGSFATLGKAFEKIPTAVLRACGWLLAALLIVLLLAEAGFRTFGIAGTYTMGFVLLGTAAEVLAVLWIGKTLLDRKHCLRVRWTATDAALMLMLIWCGLSTLCSDDPTAAFLGSDYRQEGFGTYLIYAALFFCCRRSCRERQTRILIWCICLVGMLLSVWAMLFASPFGELAKTKFGPTVVWYNSVSAVFSNPNHFAYFLSMTILAAAGLFVTETSWCRCGLAATAYVIQTLMLLRNATLGGYLAVLAGLILLLILSHVRKDGFAVRVLMLLTILILFMLIQRYVGYDVSGDVHAAIKAFDTAEQIGSSDVLDKEAAMGSSGVDRLLMWKQAVQYTLRRPLLGHGADGSGVLHFCDTVEGSDRPHNEYLQYAVYFGIPGVLMYLTALVSLFVRCVRDVKRLSSACLVLGCMVFSYCASAFVGNSMYYTTVYFVMILALRVNESVRNMEK